MLSLLSLATSGLLSAAWGGGGGAVHSSSPRPTSIIDMKWNHLRPSVDIGWAVLTEPLGETAAMGFIP